MNPTWKEAPPDNRKVNPTILLRLAAYALPYRWLVMASVAVLMALSGIELAGPWLIREVIDGPMKVALGESELARDVAAADGALTALLVILGIYAGMLVLDFVLQYLQSFVTVLTGQRIMYSVRRELFAHLQRLGLSYYDANPVGTLVTRVTSDIESLTEMFSSGLAAIFHNLAKALLILVVLFFFNVGLALMTLAFVPPMVIGTWLFARAARLAFRKMRGAMSHANAFLQEATSGVKITRLFGAQAMMTEEFDRRNQKLCDAHISTVWVYSLMFPYVTVMSAVAIAGMLYFGAGEANAGRLTAGEVVQFYLYLNFFFEPVRELSERWNILQSAAASAERIFEVMDTHPDVTDPAGSGVERDLDGAIDFEGVTFGYHADEPVLRDVSFRVAPGERVAIVGATGAGKTTIISLLSRFYDVDSGVIRIDGVPVAEYRQRALRKQIAVVLQDVFMFTGNITDNISLGDPDIDDARIRAAAAASHADTFIQRLPGAYQAEVTERGANFSAGERQLLAFARAFAANPRILVLDEATANIDSQTEGLIQDALHRLMEDRTSVVIAHRLSTIRDCDRILVMHKGELREQGTHEELLAAQGIYWRLYQLQFGGEEA